MNEASHTGLMADQDDRERRRLVALEQYGVLDTPRETAFDEVAELVAAICDAPIAVVNFIADGRQFFKAEVGLGVRETPLETSFCARAILEEDFLIVPDATQDPRFDCNPLVTDEPHLRFYAGALLKSPDGLPIGTLCVLDHKPRELTDLQIRTIKVLARQVMAQLEQRVAARRTANSEARHRAIVDSAREFAIIAMDLDGIVVEWSHGAEQVLGWTEAEALGRDSAFFFTEEDCAAGVPPREIECARKEGRAVDERWHVRKGGERFWASGELSPLNDRSGAHTGYVKILRDRTEQHLAGQALEASQLNLRWAQEAGGVGVFHVGVDGILHATPEFCRLYGMDECASAPARVFEDLVISEDRHLVSDLESRAAGSAPIDVEYRIRRADSGELRWIARKGSIQRDESGKPVGFAGVARDVTDHRAARDALARSEERFKTIVETIEAAFAIVEVKFDADDRPIDYRFLEANPAFERQSGVDLRGKWVTEYAPDLEQFWFDTYGHVAKTGEPATFESYAEAFKRWFDVRAVRVGDPADRQIAIFFNDSTPRKDAERRLVELKDTLEQEVQARTTELNRLWQTSPDLLLLIDFEGHLRRVNPAWTSMLGYEPDELIGHHVNEFVLPDDHNETVDAYTLAAEGGMPRIVNRYRHKDGSVRWISWVAAQGEEVTYATGRDVTAERQQAAELTQAQEQLRQAQKMEAVGQLTGGIAHDFNNMLTGVIGSLDLIQRHIKTGRMETVDRYIDAANTSAQRAAALTARLLAFGRRQSLDLKPIDVNGLVSGMEDLLRRTLGEQVVLETHFATNLWAGHTDAHQLESALLNLCINARDAMPNGGKLTVETANTHLDERYAREHTDVSPGDYVVICVSDTGIGMAPSTVEKVFEPFFTTKPVGQGTGLGLSMIYGFARQAGGHVRIYSELGQGTTIKLYVPRFEGEVELATGEERQAPAGEGETVLLVEDDASVRMIVMEVLEELGYASIEASDGRAAVPILQSDRKIDLLISDVGLPGLNGRQIAEIAREHRPDLRVLFITGYAQNAAVRGGFLDRGMEMMTKPFAVDALATKIRQMLEVEAC